LATSIDQAQYNETIAVCGEIFMLEPIEIQQSNMTICCFNDTYRCALNSTYGQNLLVTGANVTLRGLAFYRGYAAGDSGGNLKIDAPGHHTVSQCLFADGSSQQYGGNLYVSNADSIHISASIFDFGYAEFGAGGAAFVDTPVILVEGSFFYSNQGGRDGGGVLVSNSNLDENTMQNITFNETFFEYNSAAIGGGFMMAGSMTRIVVVDSYFEGNEASAFGGAGAILGFSSIVIFGNKGENNFDPTRSCNDFYIAEDSGDFLCAEVWDYLALSSGSGFPSTFPPLPSFPTTHSPAPTPAPVPIGELN
jgi:hypothetical protein